jgi:hypothetical protein
MRLRWVLVVAALVLQPVTFGVEAASFGPAMQPEARSLDLLRRVAIECGTFEGQYTCRFVRGGAQHGKNAPPVQPAPPPTPESTPADPYATPAAPGTWSTESNPSGAAPAPDPNACQGGMIGTPPNCRCPPSSELLGGNCVRYTASACSNGLAADALPQACRGVEEKLSCTMRNDGLKDCCCVTYDKF